jgi:hypothetical protein
MRYGQRNATIIRVYNKNTGALIPSLTLSDFTIRARCVVSGSSAPANWTHNAALVADASISGQYWLFFDMPQPGPRWMLEAVPNNALYVTNPEYMQDTLTLQDEDSIYSGLARTAIADPTFANLGQPLAVQKVAYRWDDWTIPIKSGSQPADLSGYTNLELAVRSLDQTSVKLDAVNGVGGWTLTGDINGNLHIVWPDSTGTVGTPADIYGTIQAGQTFETPLYWEVSGLVGGVVGKRANIIRSSPLVRLRREYGS